MLNVVKVVCFHAAGNSYLKCFLLAVRYGFRSPPHLELKARPKLGEREVTLVHVTDWIERKLDQEFQVYNDKSRKLCKYKDLVKDAIY